MATHTIEEWRDGKLVETHPVEVPDELDRRDRTARRLDQALDELAPAAFNARTAAGKLEVLRLVVIALVRYVRDRNEADVA